MALTTFMLSSSMRRRLSGLLASGDLDGFHGNYQKARSWQDVKAYCMKGGNFISSFDVDAATRKKSCGRALNKRLLEEDLTDLVQEGVVRLQDYLRIKAAKEAFIRDQTASLPRCVGFIPNTFNLCFPMITGKQRHLWDLVFRSQQRKDYLLVGP